MITWIEMRLGVPAYVAKDIGYSRLGSRKMVYIDLEFVLYLEPPVYESGFNPIYKGV